MKVAFHHGLGNGLSRNHEHDPRRNPQRYKYFPSTTVPRGPGASSPQYTMPVSPTGRPLRLAASASTQQQQLSRADGAGPSANSTRPTTVVATSSAGGGIISSRSAGGARPGAVAVAGRSAKEADAGPRRQEMPSNRGVPRSTGTRLSRIEDSDETPQAVTTAAQAAPSTTFPVDISTAASSPQPKLLSAAPRATAAATAAPAATQGAPTEAHQGNLFVKSGSLGEKTAPSSGGVPNNRGKSKLASLLRRATDNIALKTQQQQPAAVEAATAPRRSKERASSTEGAMRAAQAAQEEADRLRQEAMKASSAAAAAKSQKYKEGDVVETKGMTKRMKQKVMLEAEEAAAKAAAEARAAAERAANTAQEEADRLRREMEQAAAKEAAAAEAARGTPQAAETAMDKILTLCMLRSEWRAACEAAAPVETDIAWRDKDEAALGRAVETLEVARQQLLAATEALREATTSSASLLGELAEDVATFREHKKRWNKEVDSLAILVEEATAEEGKCQASVQKLEQIKARAAATVAREMAIKSEAEALVLKRGLMDAIRAIEELDDDEWRDRPSEHDLDPPAIGDADDEPTPAADDDGSYQVDPPVITAMSDLDSATLDVDLAERPSRPAFRGSS